MESSNAPPNRDEPDEALRRLQERLDRASDAAERLISEAAQAAGRRQPEAGVGQSPRAGEGPAGHTAEQEVAGGSQPPPSGWQSPQQREGALGTARDLEVVVQLLRSVRELIPSDLQQRLAEALRELLMAVRALLDWCIERLERRRAEPAQVQDIPIV